MSSIDRVREYLQARGLDAQVVELAKSTRTAQMAADAIGTELGSIVKSLVFIADDATILALVAGDKRADLTKLGQALNAAQVRIASADEVREKTGFAIGGVPPVAHSNAMPTLIDGSLGRFETVYAAAGSPRAIFPIEFKMLTKLTQGRLADITED
jgi:prolyl-tRNA editing enzyme YbaK/EbsC (Cys-tRNA(Pro) deacylase)